VYDEEGNYGRVFRVLDEAGGTLFPGPHPAVFGDRTFLSMRSLGMTNQPPGIYRPDVVYEHTAPDGTVLGPFVQLPLRAFSIRRPDPETTAFTPVLFGAETQMEASDSTLWVGRAEDYTLEEYGLDGRLHRLVRFTAHVPGPVLPEHREMVVAERLEQIEQMLGRMGSAMPPGWAEAQRANILSLDTPATFPAYAGLVVDPAGNLWVRSYPLPDEEAQKWAVFDPEGSLLGTLTLPEKFEPLDIGADYLLGVWKDELDLEYVRLYEIHKGGNRTS
jgi:hypothetical protein